MALGLLRYNLNKAIAEIKAPAQIVAVGPCRDHQLVLNNSTVLHPVRTQTALKELFRSPSI